MDPVRSFWDFIGYQLYSVLLWKSFFIFIMATSNGVDAPLKPANNPNIQSAGFEQFLVDNGF